MVFRRVHSTPEGQCHGLFTKETNQWQLKAVIIAFQSNFSLSRFCNVRQSISSSVQVSINFSPLKQRVLASSSNIIYSLPKKRSKKPGPFGASRASSISSCVGCLINFFPCMNPAFFNRMACGFARRVKPFPSSFRIRTCPSKGPKLAP